VDEPLVQILVEVATTQVRPLWTEVEKGFAWTAMGREWVAPEWGPNGFQGGIFSLLTEPLPTKGNPVNIPELRYMRVRCGDAKSPNKAGASSRKSPLFFLTWVHMGGLPPPTGLSGMPLRREAFSLLTSHHGKGGCSFSPPARELQGTTTRVRSTRPLKRSEIHIHPTPRRTLNRIRSPRWVAS